MSKIIKKIKEVLRKNSKVNGIYKDRFYREAKK